MKTIKAEITIFIQIEVDESSEMYKEYKNDKDLISDCHYYNYSSVLPIISEKIVNVNCSDVIEIEIFET